MNTITIDKTSSDTEYIILENIYNSSRQQSALRQRDLAQIAGASLGMTNSILKRLAQKGWITVKKLNSRNIQYAVTLDGINEIFQRSYRYFKRTIKNVVYYKDMLEEEIYRARRSNISRVVLVGVSDLDFIVEHACRRHGLVFVRIPVDEKTGKIPPPGTLKIYSENITGRSGSLDNNSAFPAGTNSEIYHASSNVFYLSRLIIKQAAGSNENELS